MIDCLKDINQALNDLQTAINHSQKPQIKSAINHLLDEVKYLEDKEISPYVFLASEIYAIKLRDIPAANRQLERFKESTDNEIILNCQLRYAFYNYIQGNYKEAVEYLNSSLKAIDRKYKLKAKAKVVIDRILNLQQLQKHHQKSSDFESLFIISFIKEGLDEEAEMFKRLQNALSDTKNSFQRYQILKRLVTLYQSMKAKEISTINVNLKNLQAFKQEIQKIAQKKANFQQQFQLKSYCIQKIVSFAEKQSKQIKQNELRKALDLKLLAHCKLMKVSKFTKDRATQNTLIKTAEKLLTVQDSTPISDLFCEDFVQNQFKGYQHLYKIHLRFFFSKLCNFVDSPRKKDRRTQFELKEMQQSSNQLLLKEPKRNDNHFEEEAPELNQTSSEMIEDDLAASFKGSNMVKVYASKEEVEQRYFYIKPESFQSKPRIYYAINKSNVSESDEYYSLKGLQRIELGKKTEGFKRKIASKYPEGQCFSLKFGEEKDRNFYVPEPMDFQRWIYVLNREILQIDGLALMKATMAVSKFTSHAGEASRIKPNNAMKKSRKVVDI